jgi:hypothetical protein
MVEVTLQVTASGILRDGIEVGDVEVDDFGALRLHVGDRPFHQSFYLWIGCGCIDITAENAKARAPEAILVEELGVIFLHLAVRFLGDGVGGIVTGDDAEHCCGVRNRSCKWASHICFQIVRDDAVPAHKANGWPNAD